MRKQRSIWCRTIVGLVVVVAASRLLDSPVLAAEPSARQLAEHVVKQAGIQRGICSVLGGDGNVAIEIARISQLLVNVRHPQRDTARDIMNQADDAGYGIDRLAVEVGPLDRLPYADRLIDVVVATHADNETLSELSIDEILRVLRPQGVAIIGSRDAEAQAERAGQSGAANVRAWTDDIGSWVQFSKPAMPNTDEWSHWEKGPDNNPVSTDAVIKAPYMTQFMTGPYYIGMPSITTASGGRTFLAIGHIAHHPREWDILYTLIARNGYNGTVLWQRKLPEGYLVHRSAFIATPETFYMIDGDRCLMLDAETGESRGVIQPDQVRGQWKWMAMHDGVLYFLAGKPGPKAETKKGERSFGGWSWADLSRGYYKQRIPHGFGDTLAAYDLAKQKILWTHKEQRLIDSRGMALKNNKVFFYCPDLHLRCLDMASGQIVWTNADQEVLGLIERPGKGLTSTPGFKTACITVATPQALIIQGQTRMNVVAVATESGSFLWKKDKITNNPNAIYLDGNVILGVGPRGTHQAIEPATGNVVENLQFGKRACTRLTASTDSLFVRGEGLLRYDRNAGKVLVDGSARPACNDGAIPANGLLYIGPWQCDCNLSLIGFIGRCSAGDFRFEHVATEAERLQLAVEDLDQIEPLPSSSQDWWTYRANNHRSASTELSLAENIQSLWEYNPAVEFVPTAPTTQGGLIFFGGDDGKVRALSSASGDVQWEFATSGPIKYPPTIWEGRAYFGSGDGYVYALEAATGRLLWRFRAAPVERHIHAYGTLSSTWPVQSGVLIDDGIAYFAAGIIDYDGTYIYALDAKSGQIRWQNNSSGHLSQELRKGISAQGNLAINGDQLLLAGGNQVSPARFELATGKCLSEGLRNGNPKANNGKFVGVFNEDTVIAGGRILYSSPRNVSTKGNFQIFNGGNRFTLAFGGIPPAWNDQIMTLVNFQHGTLACCEVDQVKTGIDKANVQRTTDRPGGPRFDNLARHLKEAEAIRWEYFLGDENKFEVLSMALCRSEVVAVLQQQQSGRAQPQWFVAALNAESGKPRFRDEFHTEPLPGGLAIDRDGRIAVMTLGGSVLCYGGELRTARLD